jgi:hypothetical protein
VHCGELTPFVVNHNGQPTTELSSLNATTAAAAADQEGTPKSTMTNFILPDSNDIENDNEHYDHCEVNDDDDDDDDETENNNDENERLYLQQCVLHAAYSFPAPSNKQYLKSNNNQPF